MTRSLLFIEPENVAAAKPLIDDLTRKITAAYRAAEPGKGCYGGVHTCVCGANSACRDYYLPDGTMTNSLCIHYVAQHRSEVPEQEIDRVSRLTFGQCIPSEVELCGGRAPENLPSDFIGSTRLESLESMGILLRPVISAADGKELNEAIRYFRLVEIFAWMPTSAITPFVVALRKTDQEPENWSKAAQTAEGFRAATFEPLVCLLDDSDPDTRAWASRSIGTLASRKIGREPTFRAVSTLTGLIENNSEEAVLEAAIYALGNLGAAAKPAMAPIFDLIYNEKLDRTTCALSALNKIGNWGRLAIPVLKADLMNSDKLVRRRAAGLLACLGYFGRSAIPALLDSFHDETGDVYVKRDARNAIRAIDPSVANLLRTAAIQNQPTTTRQILRASGNYHFARVIRSGKCILGTLFGK